MLGYLKNYIMYNRDGRDYFIFFIENYHLDGPMGFFQIKNSILIENIYQYFYISVDRE